MPDIATDIWFRTGLTLEAIAEAIGLTDTSFDAENYWEWVIGTLGSIELDVTRTHTLDSLDTDTRIFRVDTKHFTDSEIEHICEKIVVIAESDICWGQWQYRSGDEFDKIEISRFANSRSDGEQ